MFAMNKENLKKTKTSYVFIKTLSLSIFLTLDVVMNMKKIFTEE